MRTSNKYNFDFTVWSRTNQCAAADIIDGEETQIFGVLYNIPDEKVYKGLCRPDSKCLDQIEGEGSNYQRIKIEVEDLNGKRIDKEVLTYVVNNEKRDFTVKTSSEYVSHIILGLENVNAPNDYVNYVKGKAKLNNQKLKI